MRATKDWMFVLPAIGGVLLAGCGASTSGKPSPTHTAVRMSTYLYRAAAARVPACAHAGRAIVLPGKFPHDFPMPPHTVITSWHREVGAIAVVGSIPSTSFVSTAAFFNRELPLAGYKVLYHQTDVGRDAEGTFRGKGYVGRWQLEFMKTCNAVGFGAAAQRSKK